MIQFLVNHFLTIWKQFLALSLIALLAGCSTAATDVKIVLPFRYSGKVASAAPYDKPALLTEGDVTLMAWPGEPASPGIRLLHLDPANAGVNEAKVLPLGRVPYHVTLYPADLGTYHLLWLDQTLPGETQVAASLVSADGQVLRDPGVISKRPTAQYYAVPTTDGDLLILWVASDTDHSLFVQMVDRKGRLQQAVRLAKNASNPSAAFDLNGDLHVAWLEAAPSHTWSIHYAVLPKATIPYDDTTTNTLIGLLPLADGQILSEFVMGIDASHIYCLWTTTLIGQKTNLPDSQLSGLMFPLSDEDAAQALSFDKLSGINVRYLAIPTRTLPSLTIGLIASYWQSNRWVDVPAAMVLSPQGAGELHPVYEPQSQTGLIDKVALAVDRNGTLTLGWSDLRGNGSTSVYMATTR